MCIKGTEYAEIGGGFVVLDRWSRSPFPSTNPNRAEFFGVVRPTCRATWRPSSSGFPRPASGAGSSG